MSIIETIINAIIGYIVSEIITKLKKEKKSWFLGYKSI